ncbi:hypothetical protein PO909_031437 [Leuciscus waleckii]
MLQRRKVVKRFFHIIQVQMRKLGWVGISPSLHRRRWCSGIMQDSHSCDPGSIPGRRTSF